MEHLVIQELFLLMRHSLAKDVLFLLHQCILICRYLQLLQHIYYQSIEEYFAEMCQHLLNLLLQKILVHLQYAHPFLPQQEV